MKRVLLIVFMVCFFTVPSISQTNYQLTPFNKKGKWGYVNEKEKVVIKAKYQEAGIFNSGYAIVKKDNKYGIIDYNNQEAIPLAYDDIIRLDSGIYFIKLEDKYGVVSADGKEIIAPKYDSIKRLDSGIYFTKLKDKYGVLLADGKEIIAPKYDSIERKDSWTYLSMNDGQYKIIDSGEYLTRLEGKYGVLSADGKEIIPLKYDSVKILNCGKYLTKLEGKYGVLSADGKEIYDSIERLDSKSFLTKHGGKYGVLLADGKEIIAPKYDSIERDDDSGIYFTKLEGKYGILSSDGKVRTLHKYDSIKKIVGNFHSLYITKQDNKYGLISSTYKELLSPCLLSLDLDKLGISNSYQIAKTSSDDSYIIQIQGSSVIVTDVKWLNNNELLNLFQKKKLLYNDFEKDNLANYIEWFSKNITNDYNILSAPSFEYKRGGYPNIEVEQNDNIYTYPTVFVSEKKDDDIIFYNTKVSPNMAGDLYSTVHGVHYSTHFLTMDKIKIGKQTEDIRKCFSPLFRNNSIQVIEPTGYVKNTQNPDKLLLTVNATYADKPDIVYTQPQYIVLAGQLLEVNSGVNYIVPLYEFGHLCLIDTSTMDSKLITLKGISNVFMKYDKIGEYLYFMNKSVYGQGITTLSQDQSPIYVASMNKTSSNGNITIHTAIIPKEGDVITDIQRSVDGEYIYLCGSTTKQGYVGYENGILIILKKNKDAYEEIARFCSKNKDRYYSKIVVLDNENVCLMFDNYDNYHNPKNFDIINIPSIINKEQ